jgi:hypothetical protein
MSDPHSGIPVAKLETIFYGRFKFSPLFSQPLNGITAV